MKLLVLSILLTGIWGGNLAASSPDPVALKPVPKCGAAGDSELQVSLVKDQYSNRFTITFMNDSPLTATVKPSRGLFVSGYDYRGILVVGRIEHTSADGCGWGTRSTVSRPVTSEERHGFLLREIQGETIDNDLVIAPKSSAALVITPVVNTFGMLNEDGTIQIQICCNAKILSSQKAGMPAEFRFLSDFLPFTLEELLKEKQVPAQQRVIRRASSGW